MITARDIEILLLFVRYYILSRAQVQRLCFPGDTTGRITRRRLQVLVEQHLLNRQPIQFAHPTQTPVPVYYPARKGCELLAEHFGDERYLLTPTQQPIPHHALHWLAVSDTHIALDAAIAGQKFVTLDSWISEWDVVNKDETSPDKRYRLYTLIQEHPRLVCVPDGAFSLSVGGIAKTFYLEQDRATSGAQQVASSKTQGYAAMAERQLHRRHFSATLDEFSVLMIAPSDRRRDALKKTIAGKPGAHLWRFTTTHDFMPSRALFDPIWHACDGDELRPLVKRPANDVSTTEPVSADSIAVGESL